MADKRVVLSIKDEETGEVRALGFLVKPESTIGETEQCLRQLFRSASYTLGKAFDPSQASTNLLEEMKGDEDVR